MTRFVRQHDRCSCGIIAIINSMKFQGQTASLRDVGRLRKKLGLARGEGLTIRAFQKHARESVGLVRMQKPLEWQFIKELSMGNALVIVYEWAHVRRWVDPEGVKHREEFRAAHYELIAGIKVEGVRVTFKCVNGTGRETVEWLPLKEFWNRHRYGRERIVWIPHVFVLPRQAPRWGKRKSA